MNKGNRSIEHGSKKFKLPQLKRFVNTTKFNMLIDKDDMLGAGGTDSMDWAGMVMQMYRMWAQRRGYGVTIVDEMRGEVVGIKRATFKVDGEYTYGYAKAEVGAHRLVRISPFDSAKRPHTSFAAVAVTPILGDGSHHVHINETDLRIERYHMHQVFAEF